MTGTAGQRERGDQAHNHVVTGLNHPNNANMPCEWTASFRLSE